eukprot:20544-Heterococcus_DN1.PRE.3
MLPTVISGTWRGVDSEKLTRDEQVWLSTTYVQVYAFLSMAWQQIRCQGTDNAWAVKAPTWPLFAVFVGEFLAIVGALVWVSRYGFSEWSANLISVTVSAALAIHWIIYAATNEHQQQHYLTIAAAAAAAVLRMR